MANLNVENLTLKTAPEVSKEILDNTQKTLGFIPNMYAKMANNPSLLEAYINSYNSFREHSGFSPIEQEVVFLSVAYENNCKYCMAAHSFIADEMSKVPIEITDAIREGKKIPNLKLAALSKLTRSITVHRGIVSQNEIANFLKAGYDESHILGIITGVAVKTMSNYSNHITHPTVDPPFEGRIWNK